MKRYSLKECQKLLGDIDFKTLQRWMEKANIEPEKSRSDERLKHLTREQLEVLAQAHERELPDQDTPSETSIPHTDYYKLLLDRLRALEEWQAAEREARTERENFHEQFRSLQTNIDELNKRTEGIMLLLEERRRQKIAEESELANQLSSLKLQLDVIQSQANSFVEWYGNIQRANEQNSRDMQKLNQVVQAEQNERETLAKQVAKIAGESKRPAPSRQRTKTPGS